MKPEAWAASIHSIPPDSISPRSIPVLWNHAHLCLPVCLLPSSTLCYFISLGQTFSSAPCSLTPSVNFPPSSLETRFHPIDDNMKNYNLVEIQILTFWDRRPQNPLDQVLTLVTRIRSSFNFRLDQILICYHRYKIFKMCSSSERYLHVMILLSVLVNKNQHETCISPFSSKN
jgi:hypothetical protein